jgi:hypothetical protein
MEQGMTLERLDENVVPGGPAALGANPRLSRRVEIIED